MNQADDNTVIETISYIDSGSLQILKSCEKLKETMLLDSNDLLKTKGSLRTHTSFEIEWSRMLGHFRAISSQLNDITEKMDQHDLQNIVAVPTDPVSLPTGQPTMVIPELLRTKCSPEQSKITEALFNSIKPSIPSSQDENEREKQMNSINQRLRSSIKQYNDSIDHATKKFLRSNLRAVIRTKGEQTLSEYSVKHVQQRPAVGLELLSLLHNEPSEKLLNNLKELQC